MKVVLGMTATDFMTLLRQKFDALGHDDRCVFIEFHPGLVTGMGRGSVSVTLVNLPLDRVRERRGGGAEAENNRALYFVNGFHSEPHTQVPAERVQVEQLVDNVGSRSERLRKKTASPEKVASYLAEHVGRLAANHPPRYTHD